MAARGSGSQPGEVLLGSVTHGGFPARRLRRSNYDGGEWVTVYRAEQRSRLHAMFLSQNRPLKTSGHASPPANTREVSGAPRGLLNRDFILRQCFVEHPSDLSIGDISGKRLKTYKDDQFAEFDNLVHINASENDLPMEAFKELPVLEKLELSLCRIVNINLRTTDFSKLQFLDVSYNSLSGTSLLTLGTLPCLEELHLTGNNVVALPVEFSRSFTTEQDTAEVSGSSFIRRFRCLKKLWLDNNKLTDQSTFSTLAGLRQLKYLNLADNELHMIPPLRLMGTFPFKPTSPHTQTQRHTHSKDTQILHHGPTTPFTHTQLPPDAQQKEAKTTGNRHTQTPTDYKCLNFDSERPLNEAETSTQIHPEMSLHKPLTCSTSTGALNRVGDSPLMAEGITQQVVGVEGRPQHASQPLPSMAPFPQLQTLDITNNLFFSAGDLLACGSWPALKNLIIYGNPLIQTCRGMPTPLQTELVEKKSIRITRHKPKSKEPFCIGKAAKAYRKVSTTPPPTIPKHPLLALPPLDEAPLMIEPPPPPSPSLSPSPSLLSTASPTSHHTQSESEAERRADDRLPGPNRDEHSSVTFITQASGEVETDFPGDDPERASLNSHAQEGERVGEKTEEKKASSVREKMELWRKGLREKYSNLPEEYRGYEALLDGEREGVFTFPIPKDIRGCVHALHNALKHPLTHTKRRHSTSSCSHTKLPPLPLAAVVGHLPQQTQSRHPLQQTAASHSARELQLILEDIRQNTTSLEENLADILQQESGYTNLPHHKSTNSPHHKSTCSPHHKSTCSPHHKPTNSPHHKSTNSPHHKSTRHLQKEGRLLLAELQAKYKKIRSTI